ncbi:hypothetical protein [Burkholderia ambifaria]|jgi:hypothetical protein|uniref:hypothetical protein n=1 Tax=Burkholderia ambifaria TaxID=152480 RepID=UPI0015899ADA|nr:hypothetical protein [Burkholderia ambifaria]
MKRVEIDMSKHTCFTSEDQGISEIGKPAHPGRQRDVSGMHPKGLPARDTGPRRRSRPVAVSEGPAAVAARHDAACNGRKKTSQGRSR